MTQATISVEVIDVTVEAEETKASVVVDDVRVTIGEGIVTHEAPRRDTFTPTNGQTVFVLSQAPVVPAVTEMMINGVQASYGTDFMLTGTSLTWTGPFPLASNDTVEVQFQ